MLSKAVIAIDFGSSAIKVVEFDDKKNRKLKIAGLESLPTGSIVDGTIINRDVVADALKSLLKRLKIKTFGRRAGLSVGGSSVLLKKVWVPQTEDDGEMYELINTEAEQNFHGDMNELYWQHLHLTEPPNEKGDVPLLLTAVSRDIVDTAVEIVRECGLRTGIVDCDVFCALNSYEYNYGLSDSVNALVNIGASLTQVAFVKDGNYLFSRDINVGGQQYTNAIKETLDINHQNAEAMKISASQMGGDQNPEVIEVISGVNNQVSGQIANTVADFLQASFEDDFKIESAYLVGGASKTLGLEAAIAAQLQIPTSVLNPFNRVDIQKSNTSMNYLLDQGHLFGVASGLALRQYGEK